MTYTHDIQLSMTSNAIRNDRKTSNFARSKCHLLLLCFLDSQVHFGMMYSIVPAQVNVWLVSY